MTGSQPSGAAPSFKSLLVSTEDGSHLGTVTLDPQRPRFALVTFNDGSTTEWELYPEGMFGARPAPVRPAIEPDPLRPATPPVRG